MHSYIVFIHCLILNSKGWNQIIRAMEKLITHETRQRVEQSFNRQSAMKLIRATMPIIDAGYTEIHLPHWEELEQQHGFIHGGVVGMIADSAAGFAAMTMTSGTSEVLTVEYKINMLKPAKGDALIAQGKVVRAGRTLIVTAAEVFACLDGTKTLCALMQQTIMVLPGKAGNS